jgi:hypothetical protein
MWSSLMIDGDTVMPEVGMFPWENAGNTKLSETL